VVQREAAHRFAGAPHAPESLPALLIKPEWQAEIVRHLRRTDFDPAPGVDTSVLWLARRVRPLVHATELERYERFIKACFGQGGNTIVGCLRSAFTHAEIRRLGTDLRFRLDVPPSALSFDQWLGLFRFHMLR
jgi:16S rRNA A1518/A1519 N6-dimethyltransferase RsmA/KsgA/DIM1 with predicted DNA glycosylase/AP lyase activity